MAYFAIVSVTDTVLLIKPSICMSCVSGCSCDCHKHVHSEQSVLSSDQLRAASLIA